MFDFTEIKLQAKHEIRSLCWDGNALVDWIAGGNRYSLDGNADEYYVPNSFPFDAAVVSPSKEFAVIYVTRGTKAELLHKGKPVRELNRSYSHSQDYEYPITFARLSDGKEVIIHCPEYCNRLEIEDAISGERLTASDTRIPSDYFFSRLAVSSNGEFLMSAGWEWHPVEYVKVFRIAEALENPSYLDGRGIELDTWGAYAGSACFAENNRLITTMDDILDFSDDDEESEFTRDSDRFGTFRIFSLNEAKLLWQSSPQSRPGIIMPIGENHVIGFFGHPKLFDLKSGAVMHRWTHLAVGKHQSSIFWGDDLPVPPIAFDPDNYRFAIAHDKQITVIQLMDKFTDEKDST